MNLTIKYFNSSIYERIYNSKMRKLNKYLLTYHFWFFGQALICDYSRVNPRFSNAIMAAANKPALINALALNVSKKEGGFRDWSDIRKNWVKASKSWGSIVQIKLRVNFIARATWISMPRYCLFLNWIFNLILLHKKAFIIQKEGSLETNRGIQGNCISKRKWII